MMEIYIDRNYVKSECKKVFKKWDHKLENGFDMYDEEEFLNELVECVMETVRKMK